VTIGLPGLGTQLVILLPSRNYALSSMSTLVQMLRQELAADIRLCTSPAFAAVDMLRPVVESIVSLALERGSMLGEFLEMVLEAFSRREQLIALSAFGPQPERFGCVHWVVSLDTPLSYAPKFKISAEYIKESSNAEFLSATVVLLDEGVFVGFYDIFNPRLHRFYDDEIPAFLRGCLEIGVLCCVQEKTQSSISM
jgi:hypothetical protein